MALTRGRVVRSVLCVVLAVAALGAGFVERARACGMLRVHDIEAVPAAGQAALPGELAIGYQRVEVKIDNQLAITKVHQQFKNPGRRTLEGEYAFELPVGASVSDFAIWDGATRVPGVMQRREAARAQYDALKANGQVAGLVEQAGERFEAHVTPIPPGADKRIELEYRELLGLDSGLVHYRFPLTRRDGSKPALDEVVVTVDVTDAAEIEAAWSPLANVAVHHRDAHRVSISYEVSKQVPDRDFEVFVKVRAAPAGLRYRAQRTDDGAGTLMLSIFPGATEQTKRAKDVVFVVDTSGSMQGRKMRQARRALSYCLTALDPEDRFNIVRFSTDAESFADKLVPALGADLERARTYVQGLTESGGTNIDAALSAALASFGAAPAPGAPPRYVVLITDGEPTVGVTEASEILARAKAGNAGGARLFTFGVDEAAGSALLADLARAHRGESIAVRAQDDLDARLPVFFGKLVRPLFENVKLAFTGARVVSQHPRALPHFYLGRQLVVFARYPEPGTAHATVSADMDGKPVSWSLEVELPSRAGDAPGLPRAWANAEADFLVGGRDPASLPAEVREEIVRLSLAHTFVTPFTSFLAAPVRAKAEEKSVKDREQERADAPAVDLNRGVGSIQSASDAKPALPPPPPAKPAASRLARPAPAAAPAAPPAAESTPASTGAGDSLADMEEGDARSSNALVPAPAQKYDVAGQPVPVRLESLDGMSDPAGGNAPAAPGGAAPTSGAVSSQEDLDLQAPADETARRSAPKAKKAIRFEGARRAEPDLEKALTRGSSDKLKESLPSLMDTVTTRKVQRFLDGKAQLSSGDKLELAITKTTAGKPEDFANRLQNARTWIAELDKKGVALGPLSTSPKLIQTLYYSNPVQASRKLDALFAELKRYEAAAPPDVLPSTAALAPFAFPPPPPVPVLEGMDGRWRALRTEVASLRAIVRSLRARIANLELARDGKPASQMRPVVESITVEPPLVQGGQVARISLAVRYPAAARPALSWHAAEGSLTTARDGAAVWQAPTVPGAYTLTLTLLTPGGVRYDEEIEVEVYQPGNISFSPAHLDERLSALTHALDALRREHASLKDKLQQLKTAPAPPGGLISQLSTPAPRFARYGGDAATTVRAEVVNGLEPHFSATAGHVAPAAVGGTQVEGTWIAPRTGDDEWHVLTAEWTGKSDFSWLVSLAIQDAAPLPAR